MRRRSQTRQPVSVGGNFAPTAITGGPNKNLCEVVNCQGLVHGWLKDNMNAKLVSDVLHYADKAGIDARLLLATLIRESGDCHCGIKGDQWGWVDSIGVANMQQDAFNIAKAESDGEVTGTWRDSRGGTYWETRESIQAGAYYLKYLDRKLGSDPNRNYSREELARVGYRFGEAPMTRLAIINRESSGSPTDGDSDAGEVVDFNKAWEVANSLICDGGHYSC